ncbi:HAD-IIIA family hydrolase [Candidatus Pelagibacter bacterium]|nr:HAD-IIIA family hydrolase [Candidatus Pelagibacter bacterium]
MKVDDAVILVGGLGSRLGSITSKVPKPLLKIGDKSFLDHLLIKISKHNFKKIYLLCSYKKKVFFKLYNNKKIHNSKIICIDEGVRKGTGGALFKLKNKIKKNFILFNGDTFFNIDIKNFLKNELKEYYGVIALTKKQNAPNNKILNNLKINKKNILSFTQRKNNLMNGGIYYLNKKIFKFVQNKNLSLENDILFRLINEKKIKSFYYDDSFIDIGSKKKLSYLKNNLNFIKNKAFFLDRDGVINKENGYILDFKDFYFLNGVKKAIKFLNDKKYFVIIITNQASIGKSLLKESKLNQIHNKMKKEIFASSKGIVDDIFYSPYYKYSKKKIYRLNKHNRKPNNGMLKQAIYKWNISVDKSIFIGDKDTDRTAAFKSNVKFYFKKKISMYKQVKDIINNEK